MNKKGLQVYKRHNKTKSLHIWRRPLVHCDFERFIHRTGKTVFFLKNPYFAQTKQEQNNNHSLETAVSLE